MYTTKSENRPVVARAASRSVRTTRSRVSVMDTIEEGVPTPRADIDTVMKAPPITPPDITTFSHGMMQKKFLALSLEPFEKTLEQAVESEMKAMGSQCEVDARDSDRTGSVDPTGIILEDARVYVCRPGSRLRS